LITDVSQRLDRLSFQVNRGFSRQGSYRTGARPARSTRRGFRGRCFRCHAFGHVQAVCQNGNVRSFQRGGQFRSRQRRATFYGVGQENNNFNQQANTVQNQQNDFM